MRERKYVKFRVDMYEDTKFKIIDMKPERDVIHYIWTRLVMLAGKVNLEGDLFLSKNLPHTIETLAIEFNREAAQIKLALETFIELEMVELTDRKIYRVKNFAKHQNVKVKETSKNENTELKDNFIQLNKACVHEVKTTENKEDTSNPIEDEAQTASHSNGENLGVTSKAINMVPENIAAENNSDNLLENSFIPLKKNKRTKSNKKKKSSSLNTEVIGEITEDDGLMDVENSVFEGDWSLEKGAVSVAEWSFS